MVSGESIGFHSGLWLGAYGGHGMEWTTTWVFGLGLRCGWGWFVEEDGLAGWALGSWGKKGLVEGVGREKHRLGFSSGQ